jgi:hypothetical protein
MRQPQLKLWPDPEPDPLDLPIRIWDRVDKNQRGILVKTLARIIARHLKPRSETVGGEDSHE